MYTSVCLHVLLRDVHVHVLIQVYSESYSSVRVQEFFCVSSQTSSYVSCARVSVRLMCSFKFSHQFLVYSAFPPHLFFFVCLLYSTPFPHSYPVDLLFNLIELIRPSFSCQPLKIIFTFPPLRGNENADGFMLLNKALNWLRLTKIAGRD